MKSSDQTELFLPGYNQELPLLISWLPVNVPVSHVISHWARMIGCLLHGSPDWPWATNWGCVFNKLEVTVICCWDQEPLGSHSSSWSTWWWRNALWAFTHPACLITCSILLLLSLLLPLYFSHSHFPILISLPAPLSFFIHVSSVKDEWSWESLVVSSIIWV